MDIDDVIDLLTIVAVGDKRTVGQADAIQWHRIIGNLDRDACVDAIEAHRRDQAGVWVEPGHVVARVRAKQRDRLERMAAEDRAAAIDEGFVLDQFGSIDKSAGEAEEYPADWSTEQRLSAYWQRIDALKDRQEYELAHGRPGALLTKPPASAPARAKALATFAAAAAPVGLDIDETVPHVNALQVRCSFCSAPAGNPCTASGMPGKPGQPVAREKLAGFHPSRVEQAARREGHDKATIDAIVAAECRRQVTRAKSGWSERDTKQKLSSAAWAPGEASQAPSSDEVPENSAEGLWDSNAASAQLPATPTTEGF